MPKARLINWNHFGFGSLLEEDEVIEISFRRKSTLLYYRLLILGLLYYGWAGVVWYFYPFYLRYVWWGLLIAGSIHLFHVFMKWYLSAILVTNLNLIFVDWLGVFHKRYARVDYWNLDEIEVVKKGMRAFMYNYGTLNFKKINGGLLYSFDQVSAPNKVAKAIEMHKEKIVHQRNFSHDAAIKDVLSEVLARHIEEKGLSLDAPKLGKTVRDQEVEVERTHWKTYDPRKILGVGKVSGSSEEPHDRDPGPHRADHNIEIEKKMDDTGGIEIEL